jgi:hypothetical protein
MAQASVSEGQSLEKLSLTSGFQAEPSRHITTSHKVIPLILMMLF